VRVPFGDQVVPQEVPGLRAVLDALLGGVSQLFQVNLSIIGVCSLASYFPGIVALLVAIELGLLPLREFLPELGQIDGISVPARVERSKIKGLLVDD